MKFSKTFAVFFIFFNFHDFLISSTSLNSKFKENGALEIYPLENPHEITLSEDQKNEGKSKILFTQDPMSYYYILVTPPLEGNTKVDFDYEITSNSFIVTTKSSAKNHYEAVINFIKPIQENLPKHVEIESHGVDGSFTLTLRVSKTIPKNGEETDTSIKTFYKLAHVKPAPKLDLRNDSYGLKDLVDSMDKNSEGEVGKSLVGMMNSFEDALSNPNLAEKFNQTYFSTDEVAQDTTKQLNSKLQEFLGPLNDAIDIDSPNKEEFAKNASDALAAIDNGDTSSLQNLLKNIDTEKMEADGKKSSKKQMKDEAKQKKMQEFIKSNQPDPDSTQSDSKKESEKNKEEKKKGAAEKKKQAKKDAVLQDVAFNF